MQLSMHSRLKPVSKFLITLKPFAERLHTTLFIMPLIYSMNRPRLRINIERKRIEMK